MRHLCAVALFTLLSPAAAKLHAQSCAEALRRPAPAATVSARQLTISEKAWDHYHRASAAFTSGQPELGEREAAKALALAPRFAEVHLLRAVAALSAGDNDGALTRFAAAAALAPDLPWLGIGTAGALNNLHRYADARTELSTIPGPEATVGWEVAYEHARAAVGLRDLPAALSWSERAVALAPPGCTDSHLVHANALRLLGRISESVAELQTYLVEDRRGLPHSNVTAVLDSARVPIPPVVSDPPASTAVHGGGLLALK